MKSVRHKLTVVTRAIIIRRGKVLLVNNHGHNWHFFPGGHVELAETIRQALTRELREEIGTRLLAHTFIGAFDNRFFEKPREQHQEIGLIFRVDVRGQIRMREKHLSMTWVPIGQLSRLKIFPKGIGTAVRRALKTRQPFWLVEDSTKKLR